MTNQRPMKKLVLIFGLLFGVFSFNNAKAQGDCDITGIFLTNAQVVLDNTNTYVN